MWSTGLGGLSSKELLKVTRKHKIIHLYSSVCMWHFRRYSDISLNFLKKCALWEAVENTFSDCKSHIEEHLTYLWLSLLFLNSAVISPWLLLRGRERWLIYLLLSAMSNWREWEWKHFGYTLLSVERRSDWEHRVNPVKSENAAGSSQFNSRCRWGRTDADVTKCLISASLREVVGFFLPETGCKVLAHTGFSSGLSVLSDYS